MVAIERQTIGVLHCGDMGVAIAQLLLELGHSVVTTDEGRTDSTRERIAVSGAQRMDTLSDVARASDVVISLVSPEAAVDLAGQVASCLQPGSIYVDANSTSLDQTQRIATLCRDSGVEFVDAAIHGGAHKLREIAALYVSGAQADRVGKLFADRIRVRQMGEQAGTATQMKLLLAGVSKTLNALFLEAGTLAARAGMITEFLEECHTFYPGMMEPIDRMLPTYPRHAARRVHELAHVAALAAELGVPAGMVIEAGRWVRRVAEHNWPAAPVSVAALIEQVAGADMTPPAPTTKVAL